MFQKISADIKQIYKDLNGSEDFLDKFHQELRVYVKENEPRKAVDYQKLTHHLNRLANRAKKEKWNSSKYLRHLTKIITCTVSGSQNEIELDPSQDNLFDWNPIDPDE